MPRLDRPPHDLLALGEVDAALRLELAAELNVAQTYVVAEPRVVEIIDMCQLGHRISLGRMKPRHDVLRLPRFAPPPNNAEGTPQ